METAFKKYPIFLIHARTGCTCCSNENHYRGPFRTREDADRRKAYYLDRSKGATNPLGSQYAPRGIYEVVEVTVEELPDGRIICEDRVFPGPMFVEVLPDGRIICEDRVFPGPMFVEVAPDGSAPIDDEFFCKELYPD